MDRSGVYRAINSERDYQDARWGTVKENPHSLFRWSEIMAHYVTKANDFIKYPEVSPEEREAALIELRKAVAVGVAALEQHGVPQRKSSPTVVCLCGSTRFWREFQRASLEETLAGRIVLSIGAATGTDDKHFGNLPRLDELHLRKIDLADEVLILNVDGYIGESTGRELAYALEHGKRVRYLVPPVAKGCAWSYEGYGAVTVGGGGQLHMMLHGPFQLPRPESGEWEIGLQLKEKMSGEEVQP